MITTLILHTSLQEVSDITLSSPLSKHVARLAGSFRNLIYRILPHGVTAPQILHSVVRLQGVFERVYVCAVHCTVVGRCI